MSNKLVHIQSMSVNYEVHDLATLSIEAQFQHGALDDPKEFCVDLARSLYDALTQVHSCKGELDVDKDDFFFEHSEGQ